MMVWETLPAPALERIFSFLSLEDILSLTKVFPSWEDLACNWPKRVIIDASAPYRGSWLEHNKKEVDTNSPCGVEEGLSRFVTELAQHTDSVVFLDLDTGRISSKSVEELLSSQKGIKTLLVRYKFEREPYTKKRDKQRHQRAQAVGKAIQQGIVQHEPTLEKLNLAVEEFFISFKDLAVAFKNKARIFPNLKSFELLSTTGGYYGQGLEENYQLDENELKSAAVVFEKMFGPHCQLEELNFRPRLDLRLLHWDFAVFWNPQIAKLLPEYFKSGAFARLRKINIESLNEVGVYWEFSEVEAQMIIDNCKHISHIDSNQYFHIVNEYAEPSFNDVPMIKLVQHYGKQLVHLSLPFMTDNLALCIAENCPSLEHLSIFEPYDVELSDHALMSLTFLRQVYHLKLIFGMTNLSIQKLGEFLDSALSHISELCICFLEEQESYNAAISKSIQLHGKMIKKLYLKLHCFKSEESYQTLMQGLMEVLSSCENLEVLVFLVASQRSLSNKTLSQETFDSYSRKVTDALIMKRNKLELLVITGGKSGSDQILSSDDKEKLVNGMPLCRVELDDHSWDRHDVF